MLLFVATLFTRRETGRNLLENSEIHATVLSQQRSELLVENSVFSHYPILLRRFPLFFCRTTSYLAGIVANKLYYLFCICDNPLQCGMAARCVS